MKYSAYGFKKGKKVGNNLRIFDGSAGCWGVLGRGRDVENVINEITFYTQYRGFTNSNFFGLKPEGVTEDEFLAQCVDAINEGYLDYEISRQDSDERSGDLVIKFSNLHDKLRQRTMWILFTIRAMIQFNYNGTNGGHSLVNNTKINLTLREKILWSQLFYISGSGLGRNHVRVVQAYLSGGTAAHLHQMTMADFRALLRGGKYYANNERSQMTWGAGGGYYSNQDVQNIARAANKTELGAEDAARHERENVVTFLGNINTQTTDPNEAFRKFVRLVKYYKKD